MIEFLSFLGFLVVAFLTKHLNYEFPFIMNATASICIVFILFVRVFLHICLDRVWLAKRRYLFLCCMYGLLLIEGSLAVLYFTKEFDYSSLNFLSKPIQAFMYIFSTLMFLFVKQHDLSCKKLYGKVYAAHVVLDAVLVVTYLILDFLVTPEKLAECPYLTFVFGGLLGLIFIINALILIYRPYWLHKKTLIICINNLIARHKEIDLIHPPKKVLQENDTIRELVYTLDYSPVRVFEAVSLIRIVYKLMIKAGRSYDDAAKLAAGYADVIVLNLMKRKYDFSYLPSFVVKFLQKKSSKNHNVELNRRGMLVTSVYCL